MTGVWYCTREQVIGALDINATYRDYAQIDRIIESESRNVERFLRRPIIAPTLTTKYFDWPNGQGSVPWRLWLDGNTLISAPADTTVTTQNGAVTLTAGQFFAEPADYGPPYTSLEINLAGSASFSSGSTRQRAIGVQGLFGYSDDARFAGTTVGSFPSAYGVANIVVDSVGVGSLLKIDDERLIVTDRGAVDTTRTITADLAASAADTLVHTDGATIYQGEELTIDAEKMLAVDIVGNNVVVKRAWGGSVLAAHTSSAKIYANRALTIERGVLGTTAATHADGTTWTSWVIPGPANELCVAEVLNTLEQEQSGYARTVGSGESARNATGAGLDDLRDRVFAAMGRKGLTRTI